MDTWRLEGGGFFFAKNLVISFLKPVLLAAARAAGGAVGGAGEQGGYVSVGFPRRGKWQLQMSEALRLFSLKYLRRARAAPVLSKH